MPPQLPSAFRRLRLERAREPGRPDGDAETGYTIVAPIDPQGRLDPDLARKFKEACTVVRFRRNEDSVTGMLRRRPGGSWSLHYDLGGAEDDDAGYRFGDHIFAVGEYVTIMEDEGAHTYRVVSLDSV